MEKLFEMLKMKGGKIVSSNDCTMYEIAQAQACGRMYIDENGFGFVYFPKTEQPERVTVISDTKISM